MKNLFLSTDNRFPPTVSTVKLRHSQQLQEQIEYLYVKDVREAGLH